MFFKFKATNIRSLFFSSLFFVLIFSFQNCGGNFDIASVNTTSSDLDPGSANNGSNDDSDTYLKVKTFGSGEVNSCYLNMNSEVACSYGSKILKSLGRAVDFVTNVNKACALKVEGGVVCSSIVDDQIISSLSLDNIKSITAGIMNICALSFDSKVFCYFGSSDLRFVEIPELQGAKKVISNLCVINRLDQFQCAKQNITTKIYELATISTEAYSDIKSTGYPGYQRLCGLTRQGKLNCFDASGTDANVYTAISMPQNLKVIKSFGFSYEGFRGKNYYSTCVVQEDDKTLCWGSNEQYAVNPVSEIVDFDYPIEIAQQPVREIFKHTNDGLGTCLLLNDNSVKCSYNSQASLAVPFLANELDGTTQYLPLYNRIALDAYRLKIDGTIDCKRTSRWNLNFMLPHDIDPCSANITNGFISFGGLSGVKKITSGTYENYWNCALRSDGKVTCWGGSSVTSIYSDYSVLGIKQVSSMTSLGEVQGISNAVDLVNIYNGNCILNTAGDVWCWGQGPWNQTGTSGIGVSKTPIKLTEFAGFSQIAGVGLTLAGIKNGEVYQVIYESAGGAPKKSTTTKLSGGSNFKRLFLGGGNSGFCALNTLNQLYCWPGGGSMAPVLMAQNVENVYSSDTHSCAVTSNKKLICFGSNNLNGELALGDKLTHSQPMESPVFDNVQNVLLGLNYTCVSQGGPMKCVGVRPYWNPSVGGEFLLKAK